MAPIIHFVFSADTRGTTRQGWEGKNTSKCGSIRLTITLITSQFITYRTGWHLADCLGGAAPIPTQNCVLYPRLGRANSSFARNDGHQHFLIIRSGQSTSRRDQQQFPWRTSHVTNVVITLKNFSNLRIIWPDLAVSHFSLLV